MARSCLSPEKALDENNVDLILPYVREAGEPEVVAAFHKAASLRHAGGLTKELADLYFFETVVRVHRAGEGAPYTGLKPAGLSEGLIIPIADRAVETGRPDELVEALTEVDREEVMKRFERTMRLKAQEHGTVSEAREYVEAMLGLVVYSHKLYLAAISGSHQGIHEHG